MNVAIIKGPRPDGKAAQWIYDCAHLAWMKSRHAHDYLAWGMIEKAANERMGAKAYLRIARNAKEANRDNV